MPIVSLGFAFAGDAERLARRRSCPQLSIVGPSGESSGKCPSADTGKEVALGVSHKVIWLNICNAPGVYVAGRQMAGRDQVSQPGSRVFVPLVVVVAGSLGVGGGHSITLIM